MYRFPCREYKGTFIDELSLFRCALTKIKIIYEAVTKRRGPRRDADYILIIQKAQFLDCFFRRGGGWGG